MPDATSTGQAGGMRIMHIMRSPVGGLFRHVLDLTSGQARRGHTVGLIADATTGGDRAEAMLAEAAPLLALGVHRVPMHRAPHPSDLKAQRAINRITGAAKAEIIHGHGSKGGLYARIPGLITGQNGPVRAYTPHGGSLHFTPGTKGHFAFTAAERLMERGTDLFLFESQFAADRYREMIKATKRLVRIVYNGLHEDEFTAILPNKDATDLLFVGELRFLKGIDTLIEAGVEIARQTGQQPSMTLVGAGPDAEMLKTLVRERGLTGDIRFPGAMPARSAFPLGRLMVVPSRMESFPYIVLEALAAGVPLVSTNVGGIPEIFGPDTDRLVPPNDPSALATAILQRKTEVSNEETALTERLRSRVHQNFTVDAMVHAVVDAYRQAFEAKRTGTTPTGAMERPGERPLTGPRP